MSPPEPPESPGLPEVPTERDVDLRGVLVELGVPREEVDRAATDGTLAYLAMEKVVAGEDPYLDLDEVVALSGVDAEQVVAYWRALGFPDPRPGEKVAGDTDVEMLATVVGFIAEGALEPDLALQMSRVIGSAMARVATAQVDALDVRRERDARPIPMTLPSSARGTAELLALMPRVMEYTWRRHLAAAARRRIMRAAEGGESVVVGFADLVGFTAKTQQLEEHELAEVVARFEAVAYRAVGDHGGRVVKMIGDEVMFLHDDVREGAVLALAVADAFRSDEALSDVRVGLACGPVLERDGDVYGTVVNLASRIVTVAYPGSVVVSEEVQESLADDAEFAFRSLRSHYLKDIGKVPLWVMRHADDRRSAPYARERSRRAAREFLRERWAEVRDGAQSLTEKLPSGLREELFADEPSEPATLVTGQFEALTEAVLDADLDPAVKVELLGGLEASRRLHQLEEEAQRKASEADVEAERRLEEIELEARRRVEEIERDARLRIDQVLADAEERSRQANEEANRKVRRVAEEAERRADRAEKQAKADAERKAKRRRDRRGKGKPKD